MSEMMDVKFKTIPSDIQLWMTQQMERGFMNFGKKSWWDKYGSAVITIVTLAIIFLIFFFFFKNMSEPMTQMAQAMSQISADNKAMLLSMKNSGVTIMSNYTGA
jgi:flagellar biosynthesis/type III secretory pathway M-ring protein FliF/YscJ